MFRLIGKFLEEGRQLAQARREAELRAALLSLLRSQQYSQGIRYSTLMARFMDMFYSGAEISTALRDLVDAGEIRREGQVFHVAA